MQQLLSLWQRLVSGLIYAWLTQSQRCIWGDTLCERAYGSLDYLRTATAMQGTVKRSGRMLLKTRTRGERDRLESLISGTCKTWSIKGGLMVHACGQERLPINYPERAISSRNFHSFLCYSPIIAHLNAK